MWINETPQARHEPAFLRTMVDNYLDHKVIKPLLFGKLCTPTNLDLKNNDFLCLSKHPAIINAQINALKVEGRGQAMSSVFVRENEDSRLLEKEFAQYVGCEDMALCQSGWVANFSLMKAICQEQTPVYLDRFVHNSLWEGVQASEAKIVKAFKHNNLEHLEYLIRKFGPGIIAVDSIYSTDGSLCPLTELVQLAKRYDCLTVVDEAHSIGTHGEKGQGLLHELGLSQEVTFFTTSLSKAFCTRAGFVAGHARNIEYFRYKSSPFIFSSKLQSQEIAGLRATIEVVSQASEQRHTIKRHARHLRSELRRIGFPIDASDVHIVSLLAGNESAAIQLRDALEGQGVFGSVFFAPATPKNGCLVRFAINSTLNDEDIKTIISACDVAAGQLGIKPVRNQKRSKHRFVLSPTKLTH